TRFSRDWSSDVCSSDLITQRPYAVEAVFPVGPLQVTLDTTTAEIRHTEHQYRPVIAKPNDGRVPTSAFLNEEFAAISAIWAAARSEERRVGKEGRSRGL